MASSQRMNQIEIVLDIQALKVPKTDAKASNCLRSRTKLMIRTPEVALSGCVFRSAHITAPQYGLTRRGFRHGWRRHNPRIHMYHVWVTDESPTKGMGASLCGTRHYMEDKNLIPASRNNQLSQEGRSDGTYAASRFRCRPVPCYRMLVSISLVLA